MVKDDSGQRMEKLVSLCKRRGFIFQSSEIYGGINGFWDYGPLGAELKRNLRETWWQAMMRERDDIVPLDASIILHPAVWKASGHVETFCDLMVECPVTNQRFRADHVPEQTGFIYFYSGAEGAGVSCSEAFSVLQVGDKLQAHHRIAADKVALEFYRTKGLPDAQPNYLHCSSEAVSSKKFNPGNGAQLSEPRPFNLMFESHAGPIRNEQNRVYLRPETAQAIFAQFKNVWDSARVKIPFGIGQIGKAFRNEVTPRNYTFRSREFEQMELEFFIRPDEAIELLYGDVARWHEGADLCTPQSNWGWDMWHRYWVAERTAYYESLGLGSDVLDYYWQKPEELAHYARATVDILFKFPFGTEELEGIAARGDFDLRQHQKHSGKTLEVFDEELKTACAALSADQRRQFIERTQRTQTNMPQEDIAAYCENLFKGNYLPHVIEPSAGLDRLVLAVLSAAFDEEIIPGEGAKSEARTVLHFHPRIAPVKCAVFPLLKNKPALVETAHRIVQSLRRDMNVFYDESGAIGRRYRRQDEAGTPFCVTVDFDTVGENGPEKEGTVTLRHRDSMEQERISIADLKSYLLGKIMS